MPAELFAFFGGFVLVIGMHYLMAWKVNTSRSQEERIEVRRDNYLQVYRAYKNTSRDKIAPLFSGIGIVLIATGFISILVESTTEGSR